MVGNKPGKRLASGRHHIQNVNTLHACYERFIIPLFGPASKKLNGHIRWLEVQLAGIGTAELVRAS
ncbi:hypothetical protein [Marinovum sp.]|uniref:hypothetical protein n=1 Tax=Marinovum sp. TaxID=2024839 RepID=UPI003A8D47F9